MAIPVNVRYVSRDPGIGIDMDRLGAIQWTLPGQVSSEEIDSADIPLSPDENGPI